MPADLRYITIDFPVAVDLTEADQRDLHEIASRVCKRYERANPGRVMWVGEVGYPIQSMPMTSADDAAAVPMVFDEAGFQLGISEREDYRWPCRTCGIEQGEHKHSILNGKAGDCEFVPACRVPKGITCAGGFHRGWDGHDPYCERCPAESGAEVAVAQQRAPAAPATDAPKSSLTPSGSAHDASTLGDEAGKMDGGS